MLHHGLLVKVLLSSAAALAADLLSKILNVGLTYFLVAGAVAAGVAGTSYLVRLARRGVTNARAVVRRVVEIIESLPERVKAIEERLLAGEEHFTTTDERLSRIEGALDVIAAANAARIDDAIAAGDERRPRIDRRSAA